MSSDGLDGLHIGHRPARSGGFTVIEMVAVIILLGVLAAVALPKLNMATGMRDDTWRDSLVAGLRFASKSAVAQRRLVCAVVSNTQLTLTVASANPASACGVSLAGPDGSSVFASSSNSTAATVVSPAGTIYFHPDGRATSDGAGLNTTDRTITVSGVNGSIRLIGQTGHVD